MSELLGLKRLERYWQASPCPIWGAKTLWSHRTRYEEALDPGAQAASGIPSMCLLSSQKGVHTAPTWAEASLGKQGRSEGSTAGALSRSVFPGRSKLLSYWRRRAGSDHCLGITSWHPGWVGLACLLPLRFSPKTTDLQRRCCCHFPSPRKPRCPLYTWPQFQY